MEKEIEKQQRFASKVLSVIKDSLVVEYPYLARAVYELEPSFVQSLRYGTDGNSFFCNPKWILEIYLKERKEAEEIFLHSMLHCLYLHPFLCKEREQEKWNLSCDIFVCYLIFLLDVEKVHDNSRREEVFHVLEKEIAYLSAQSIYRFFMRHQNMELLGMTVEELLVLFAVDEHRLWYEKSQESDSEERSMQSGEGSTGEQNKQEGEGDTQEKGDAQEEGGTQEEEDAKEEGGIQEEEDAKEEGDTQEERDTQAEGEVQERGQEQKNVKTRKRKWEKGDAQESEGIEDGDAEQKRESNDTGGVEQENKQAGRDVDQGKNIRAERIRRWSDIAEHAEAGLAINLGKRLRESGDKAGHFLESLRNICGENKKYSEFLKQFAVLEEKMLVDLDSFDYIYYTYGMQLYEDTPLIEPLEYKEMQTIHEFVVAIDTSGSCDRKLVQKFLTKTYDILSDATIFTGELCIYILQCDAQIQQEKVIHSVEEMKEYAEHIEIYGRGGTDFRPVFSRVEELREKSRLTNIRGLLYFTDGYGIYPKLPTDYKTAFVFAEMDGRAEVPPWAMKVYIEDETDL